MVSHQPAIQSDCSIISFFAFWTSANWQDQRVSPIVHTPQSGFAEHIFARAVESLGQFSGVRACGFSSASSNRIKCDDYWEGTSNAKKHRKRGLVWQIMCFWGRVSRFEKTIYLDGYAQLVLAHARPSDIFWNIYGNMRSISNIAMLSPSPRHSSMKLPLTSGLTNCTFITNNTEQTFAGCNEICASGKI